MSAFQWKICLVIKSCVILSQTPPPVGIIVMVMMMIMVVMKMLIRCNR